MTDADPSLIHLAAQSGHLPMVKHQVAAGVAVDTRGAKGLTPLHQACHTGSMDVIAFLLDQGADLSARDSYGRTPLLVAATFGQVDACARLLARGANARDQQVVTEGRTTDALGCVIMVQSARVLAVARLLLDHGADPNVALTTAFVGPNGQRGQAQTSALLLACKFALPDQTAVVDLLLARGARLTTQDSQGQTPLHAAAAAGNGRVCEQLLRAGAPTNVRDNEGHRPRQVARGDAQAVFQGRFDQRHRVWQAERQRRRLARAVAKDRGETKRTAAPKL